jgi:beta-lactamase class A
MPAASTIKVLISAALWCAVEDGELAADRRLTAGEAPAPGGGGLLESFDPATALTVADLNVLMLALSDNAATNALIDVVGLDRVNQLAARLGLERTAVRRSMMDVEAAERGDDNVTCAGDMATLMAALGRAVEIPPRACRRVLHALGQSHHTDVIARHLSAPGRVVACKRGMLETVLHDVALVEDAGARVALAVLSSPPGAAEGLARLAAHLHAVVATPPVTAS